MRRPTTDADGTGGPDRAWAKRAAAHCWHALTSVPGIAGTAALIALTTWATASGIHAFGHHAEPPVKVLVETDPDRISSFADVPMHGVIPSGRPSTGAPRLCVGFEPWLRSQHGVDAEATHVRVVVQGLAATPVLISELRVRRVSVGPPLRGTPVSCASAGPAEIRENSIDLDAPSPQVRYGSGRRPFGFTLAQNETETFDITALVRRADVRWTMALELVVAGRRLEIPIRDAGRPFETTALPGRSV